VLFRSRNTDHWKRREEDVERSCMIDIPGAGLKACSTGVTLEGLLHR
jgi:hypothetical protein